ncbi:MAG: hypothetical protein M5U14_10515 [Acidimicrobiia bacterium]|nr:hypothetical protein [Acidimicrobiia bacterium]
MSRTTLSEESVELRPEPPAPRRQGWLVPAVVVALLVAMVAFFLYGSGSGGEPDPGAAAMPSPNARWIFEIVGPITFFVLAVYFVVQAVRTRRFSTYGLVFFGCFAMWPQEFFADWGVYLLWNPAFELLPWDASRWTTPNKPWSLLACYGWYYVAVYPTILGLMDRIRVRKPSWPRWVPLVAIVLPLFYLFDLALEGTAAYIGWWSYTEPWGPTLGKTAANGFPMRFPLVHPLLIFVAYGLITVWVMDQRDDLGRHRFEVLLGAHRLREGWRRQMARLASWAFMMNVLYFLFLIVPLVAIREWTDFGNGTWVP